MNVEAQCLANLGGPHLDGGALLGERAAFAGLTRRGAVSPGGSCRLLRTADDWIAVNLARPDDVALANAWLGDPGLESHDPWPRVAGAVLAASAAPLVADAV